LASGGAGFTGGYAAGGIFFNKASADSSGGVGMRGKHAQAQGCCGENSDHRFHGVAPVCVEWFAVVGGVGTQ
jgi:hypothetical protein